jgi:hypothetical protein
LKLRELRALKLMNVDASYGNMYANNVGLSVDRNKIIDKYYRHSDSKAKLKNIDNTHSISNIGTANKGNTNNTATKNMVSHEKNKRSTHVKRYEYVDADKDSN